MVFYYFLGAVIAIGLVTSYQDVKQGVIKNKWIGLGIMIAIILHAIEFFIFGFSLKIGGWIIVNSLLGLIIGILFWHFNIWNAGDGKLFFVFSLLIPASIYFNGPLPTINLLINAFVPIGVILLVLSVIRVPIKESFLAVKKTLQPKLLLNLLLVVFSISWVVSVIIRKIGVVDFKYFLIILLTLASLGMMKRFPASTFYAFSSIAFLRLVFDKDILSYAFWKEIVFLSLALVLIRVILLVFSKKAFTKNVSFHDLKEGMMPAETIGKKKGKYFKYSLDFSSGSREGSKSNQFFSHKPEGILKEEITAIRKESKEMPFSEMRVYETFHFAPFLFLGALLTLIMTGNIIVIVKSILIFLAPFLKTIVNI